MDLFRVITPSIYGVLTLLWGYALVFCLHHLFMRRADRGFPRILLGVLALAAFALFVESIFFGIRYSSQSGWLPSYINAFLEQPQITIGPKLLNVAAATLIVFILLRVWLPRAEHDRRLAIEAIRTSTQRYEELVNTLDGIVWEGDSESYRFTFVSPQAERLLGYPLAEWLTPNFWANHVHPDDLDSTLHHCRQAIADGTNAVHEYRMLPAAGDPVWVQNSVMVVPQAGRAPLLRGLMVDITALKRAQLARAAYEARLRTQSEVMVRVATAPEVIRGDWNEAACLIAEETARCLSVSLVGIWLLQDDNRLLRCAELYDPRSGTHASGESLQISECPRYFEALQSGRILAVNDVLHDSRTVEFAESYSKPMGITALIDAPVRIRGCVAGVLCCEQAGTQRVWEDDELLFAGSMADQVAQLLLNTERRRAEAEHARLFAAIEQVADMVVILDPAGMVQYVNPAFGQFTGHAPGSLVGARMPLLDPSAEGQDQTLLQEAMERGETWRGRVVQPHPDKTECTLEVTVSPVRDRDGRVVNFVVVLLDLTHLTSLEAKLRQAQRMEAIGRLAGGVAHDFNNILQAILGHLELAEMDVAGNVECLENLSGAQHAAMRAVSLTRQLLAFSRKQVLQRAPVNLNRVVEDMLTMVRRIIGEDIALEFKPDPELALINADTGQLEQIVLNLCINARDAMPRGGSLFIETSAKVLDTADTEMFSWVRPGPHVVLNVSDNGHGMDADTVAHIFEPFFTTKDAGHGTGLGLATVYGIVQQHDGMINVYSEPDLGTTFRLYFPAIAGLIDTEVPRSQEEVTGGQETILLADDSDAARATTATLLRTAGYTVVEARDGLEALETVLRAPGQFDLLLLDVAMPRMNGRETYERIQAIRPIPTLFASGYSGDTFNAPFQMEDAVQLLHKPFQRSELLLAVRKALSRSPRPGVHEGRA